MLTAHAPQILDSFGKFIELVAQEFSDLGVQFDGYTEPRVHKDRWLTNKSPFIYGRHKVEYEVRTYKKVRSKRSLRHFLVTFLVTFDQRFLKLTILNLFTLTRENLGMPPSLYDWFNSENYAELY